MRASGNSAFRAVANAEQMGRFNRTHSAASCRLADVGAETLPSATPPPKGGCCKGFRRSDPDDKAKPLEYRMAAAFPVNSFRSFRCVPIIWNVLYKTTRKYKTHLSCGSFRASFETLSTAAVLHLVPMCFIVWRRGLVIMLFAPLSALSLPACGLPVAVHYFNGSSVPPLRRPWSSASLFADHWRPVSLLSVFPVA